MSKIESFTIGKEKKSTCENRYLELTVRLPENLTEDGLQEAITRAELVIDNYLNQPMVPQIPQLDIAEITDLPWRKYEKGALPGSAKPDHPGWIFRAENIPEGSTRTRSLSVELAETIEKVGGKLQIGEWTFKLQGKDKNLISRSKKETE